MESTEALVQSSEIAALEPRKEDENSVDNTVFIPDVLADYNRLNKGDLAIFKLGENVSPIYAMVGVEEMVINGKKVAGIANTKTSQIHTLVCGSDRNLRLATEVRKHTVSAAKRCTILLDSKPNFQHLSVEGVRATIMGIEKSGIECLSLYQSNAELNETDSLSALHTLKDYAVKQKIKVLVFVGGKSFDKKHVAANFVDHIIAIEGCEADAGWASAMSLESHVLADLLGGSNAEKAFLQAKGLRDQLKFELEPFVAADVFSRSIWKLADSGMSQSLIAEKVGKNKSTISRILEKLPKLEKRLRNTPSAQPVAEVA